MRGEIRQISNCPNSKYKRAHIADFIAWISRQAEYQLDIETTVSDDFTQIKLISIQFGSCTSERLKWFFQWSQLTPEEQELLKGVLRDPTKVKIGHNIAFEYIVLRFYGVILENLYCTMVGEKVIRGGLEITNYALADISWQYCRIELDKTLQTAFGDDIITDEKIEYACTDVDFLDSIKRQQIMKAGQARFNQIAVMGMEMEALLAFADTTYNGIKLDLEKWRANIALAEPLVQEAYDKMNSYLQLEPVIRRKALKLGYIADEDRITINWNSHQVKTQLLQKVWPDLAGGTLAILKKYLKEHRTTMSVDEQGMLIDITDKSYDEFLKYLLKHHREDLIGLGLLIPAGTSTINWNSVDQVLPLAQEVEPKLTSLSEEAIAKTIHPMLRDLQEYKNNLKLISTYGESFIQQYVDADGYVRTRFNQIVSTGRVSSSNPNMQQIPAKKSIGNRYRNAFVCEEGWVFVDSDYVSQELVIIAYMSQDPVWLNALENNHDLHSVCAELIFGEKWRAAADLDCDYYKMEVDASGKLVQKKAKCKCKQHGKLREQIKSINFGLAYGMSEIKLAGELRITRNEAFQLLQLFFRTFPAIGATLDALGTWGVRYGYIQTLAPFWRKRWFPYWAEYAPWREQHIQGVKYHAPLGEIERASKNAPIQGSSADIVKVAMILIRNFIRDNNLWNKVKIVAQVHDQITTICIRELSEWWKDKLDELMIEAGKVVIKPSPRFPNGMLKAETNITEVWTK